MIPELTIDPEWLFPLFFDSYYYEVFNGGDASNIVVDTTYETAKNEIIQQFGVSPYNSLVYSFPVNRYSKAIITYECSDYNTACIIAQVNPRKTEEKKTITFNEISKSMVDRYLKFLRKEENSVEEGRWGEPKKDADGNIIYIVAVFDSNGKVIKTKETIVHNEIVIFEEQDSSGNAINVEYKPLYRRSLAHPTGKYPYTLDINRKKVQQTVNATDGNIVKSMWHLHQDYKGKNTIAYGHLIKDDEISSNKIQIADNEYAIDWINKGLTDEQAFKLLIYDFLIHQKEVRDIIEAPRWNALPDKYKLACVEVTYNGGGVRKFPLMCGAMGIPPTKGKITWFWPSVKEFTLSPVDNEEVKIQLNRPDVPNRDAEFKRLFL